MFVTLQYSKNSISVFIRSLVSVNTSGIEKAHASPNPSLYICIWLEEITLPSGLVWAGPSISKRNKISSF